MEIINNTYLTGSPGLSRINTNKASVFSPLSCISKKKKSACERAVKKSWKKNVCVVGKFLVCFNTSSTQITNTIDTNQVTIIQGQTGSGKTTQVAQYILDHHVAENKHCNIVVTQPRRIAAISIARRVCEERRWQIGSLVGYQVSKILQKFCKFKKIHHCKGCQIFNPILVSHSAPSSWEKKNMAMST